jgi:heptaprenyl diphosphate synthase
MTVSPSAPAPLGLDGLSAADPAYVESVRFGLDRVEARLRVAVRSADLDLVSQTARHLVEAGGKRFRPLLAVLAAGFGRPDDPAVIEAAVVVELTHLASLYHDDVMDEADVRRGVDAANSRWGNSVAILTGDYLFARASEVIADLGPEAVKIQSATFARLVTGQIRETAGPPPGVDPLEHHMRVLAEKTGSLIATSARLGAMMAGVPAPTVEVLSRYGEAVGLAFQMSDDLIDIASDPADSGKTPGTDLREGVPTLPMIFARRTANGSSADPGARRLAELLAGPVAEADVEEALTLLRRSPAMAEAQAVAESYARRARALAGSLPDLPARAALESLADYVVARTS